MLKIHLFLITASCIVSVCAYNYDYYSDGEDNQLISDGYGKFRPRMIEGVIPEIFKHAYLAAIYIQSGDVLTQFCTGTLIAKQYVMTSMRCLHNAAERLQNGNYITVLSKLRVTVGSPYKTPAMRRAPLRHIFTVIDYAASELLILKLDRETSFELFNRFLIDYDPEVGELFEIAAFGSDTMPNSSYTIGTVTVLRNDWPVKNKFLTGDFNRGVDSFDLGCPVFRRVHWGHVVIGVLQDAQNDAINITNDSSSIPSSLGVFLKLGMYCGFIEQYTHGLARCIPDDRKQENFQPIIGNKKVNGDLTAAGQLVNDARILKSLAAIYIEFEGMLKPFCTGTLIAFQYVLTSYGCLAYASAKLDVTHGEAAQLLKVSIGSSGRKVSVLEYFVRDGILILKINRQIGDYTWNKPVFITGYQPLVDDHFGIVYFKGQSSMTLSYATGTVAVTKKDWPTDATFLTGNFNRGDIDDANGSPALLTYNKEYYQVGVLINSQSGYITMDQHDNHSVQYNLGIFVKLAPYCTFIRDSTVGTATCRSERKRILSAKTSKEH